MFPEGLWEEKELSRVVFVTTLVQCGNGGLNVGVQIRANASRLGRALVECASVRDSGILQKFVEVTAAVTYGTFTSRRYQSFPIPKSLNFRAICIKIGGGLDGGLTVSRKASVQVDFYER